MSDKQKKDQIGVRLPEPLILRIDAYHKKTGIPKTVIVEKAVESYLDEKVRGR